LPSCSMQHLTCSLLAMHKTTAVYRDPLCYFLNESIACNTAFVKFWTESMKKRAMIRRAA
jgi:hypothetical protein